MYVPGDVNVNDPGDEPTETLKLSDPVLAGAPLHAELVHSVAVCCGALDEFVQETGVPTGTVTASGLKQ